ncbi:glucose-dependent insulinotropic receptor [Oncorhynchus tshawytscha]|uniref:glucose-dependent insulinotropic receptor n=1 Tax=Oncorhynchus tshawytscha TaxID=74940 RepID=UPI001C3C5D47|nr:glucose-dependent insulinotropic receptor [Oncorhynchus tshawytscha]
MAAYNKTGWMGESGANLTAMLPGVRLILTPVVYTFMTPEMMGWVLSVASLLIISTNLLVVAALFQLMCRKGSQSWCFVLNLALADILVGLAITGIVTDVFQNYNTVNNGTIPITQPLLLMHSTQKTKCLLRMAFIISPSTASILSMFLISLDRYVAIKLPLRYSQLTGRWTVTGALVALWMVSLTVGFLPEYYKYRTFIIPLCSTGMAWQLQQGDFESSSLCTFFSVIRPKGIIVVFCAVFFPVLSVFTYFYLDILKIACGHQRQIRQARQAGSRLPQRSRYWGHVKALRTVALLVGCFTLCWCPFFVVCAVQVLCEDCELYKVLENDLWLLGLSNSLINPLVYACWQREVRLQIGALFCCVKDRVRNTAVLEASERCQTELRIPTHTVISVDDAMSLDPTFPTVTSEEGHTVPFSASTPL